MTQLPFDGLTPADGLGHTRWVTDSLEEPPGVAFRVPDGFPAVVRIHHGLDEGRRWSEVAPQLLVPGVGPVPYPLSQDVMADDGNLDADIVDLLVPLLTEATSSPQRCHFALWVGWGDLHAGSVMALAIRNRWRPWRAWSRRRTRLSLQRRTGHALRGVQAFVECCPALPWWGGRDVWLFDGHVTDVTAIGSPAPWSDRPDGRFDRRGPQWWWPADRSWFVSSEIDDPWSYVAGSERLIEAVMSLDLEAVRVDRGDAW